MMRKTSTNIDLITRLVSEGRSPEDVAFILDVPVARIEEMLADIDVEEPRRPDGEPPAPKMLSLLDLTAAQCRWPYGDPQEGDFGFCGHDSLPDRPYCAFHCEESYLKPGDLEKKKRTG